MTLIAEKEIYPSESLTPWHCAAPALFLLPGMYVLLLFACFLALESLPFRYAFYAFAVSSAGIRTFRWLQTREIAMLTGKTYLLRQLVIYRIIHFSQSP
jgi:hypothetical protein